ncbi:hypothetical protein NVP2096O_21 [Vibrio phage 2.096.O._10N.286.48.B5]|nr:hypothetical protein NVP2096O_21 [Vibrio phage 2.096.O._10N.286.48.B5]
MEGSIETSDVLLNRGLNGYGYGVGNFGGDGSAVKEAVRGNRDISLIDSVNKASRDSFMTSQLSQADDNIINAINTGNQFLTDRISGQSIDFKFANITAQLASAERLAFANQASIDRQLHAMELKQTECCCELRAGQSAINAKLDAAATVSGKDAEIQRLNMQLLMHGHGNGNSTTK